MDLVINQQAPDFVLPDETGQLHHLSDYKGKIIVLYFYPKDNTPGCSLQAQHFAALYSDVKEAGGEIIGISRDNQNSHSKFKNKYNLPFILLSDIDGTVCNLYNVIKEKNMYGKKNIGIERSTFIIDKEGIIRYIQRKVKVAGHAEFIATTVKELSR